MAFKDRLLAAMEIRNLTQGQLSVKTGLSQSAISRLVTGDNLPTIERAAKLARALGVSLDWMCDLPPRTIGELAPDEDQLLTYYRRARTAGRNTGIILNTVKAMSGE